MSSILKVDSITDVNGNAIISSDGSGNLTPNTFTALTVSGDLKVDTNTLYVDSSNNRVGLFNTSPQVDLDIKKSGFVVAKLHNYDGTNPSNGVALDFLEGSQIDNVFGGASTYGFRLKLDAATNSFIIKSGNQTTINDRFAIQRDTGNVGIGTTSPDGTLHVHNGSAGTITAAAAANDLVIESNSATGISILSDDTNVNAYGNIYFGNETDGEQIGRITYFGSTYVTSSLRGQMNFRAGGVDRMHLQGSSVVFNETGADTNFRVESDSNTNMLFIDAGLNRVAIGKSSPQATLDVNGDLIFGSSASRNNLGDYGTTDLYLINQNSSGTTQFYVGGGTGDKERMRLTTAEAVINDQSNDYDFRVESNNNTHALFVDGGTDNGNIHFGGTTAGTYDITSGDGQMSYRIDNGTNYGSLTIANNADRGWSLMYANKFAYTSGDDQRYIHWFKNGSALATIQLNSAGTQIEYNTTSDRRLKENIVDIEDGITRLKQLKPRKYTWTGTDDLAEGFIADEADGIVPEAVKGEVNAVDEKGNPIYQQIEYSKYVPLLTASLKEAINKIEQLEARISALET